MLILGRNGVHSNPQQYVTISLGRCILVIYLILPALFYALQVILRKSCLNRIERAELPEWAQKAHDKGVEFVGRDVLVHIPASTNGRVELVIIEASTVLGRFAELEKQIDLLSLEAIALKARADKAKAEAKEHERQLGIDPLTGVLNRRVYEHTIKQEALGMLRTGTDVESVWQKLSSLSEDEREEHFINSRQNELCLAVIMLDIDHFKRVNDTYGHPFGDQVLRAMRQLSNRLRHNDVLCRYGGEEFIIVLSEISQGSANQLAERIREFIENLRFDTEGKEVSQEECTDDPDLRKITASLGVSAISRDELVYILLTESDISHEHLKQLLTSDLEDKEKEGDLLPHVDIAIKKLHGQSDQALYSAKKAGRNRVVVYGEEENGSQDQPSP